MIGGDSTAVGKGGLKKRGKEGRREGRKGGRRRGRKAGRKAHPPASSLANNGLQETDKHSLLILNGVVRHTTSAIHHCYYPSPSSPCLTMTAPICKAHQSVSSACLTINHYYLLNITLMLHIHRYLLFAITEIYISSASLLFNLFTIIVQLNVYLYHYYNHHYLTVTIV